jgi:hypothetical protein
VSIKLSPVSPPSEPFLTLLPLAPKSSPRPCRGSGLLRYPHSGTKPFLGGSPCYRFPTTRSRVLLRAPPRFKAAMRVFRYPHSFSRQAPVRPKTGDPPEASPMFLGGHPSECYGKIPVNAQGGTEFIPDRVHPGGRRPPMEPLEQGVKFSPGTLGKHLHIPILSVPYPTRKPKQPGLLTGGIPEPHPLNPAPDQGKKRRSPRRT